MKKVLITGAAGTIGVEVLKSLLTEGKYEISVLDLKNTKSKKIFNNYKDRVNILYGDLTDQILVEELVKKHDIIIHLATVLPPITALNEFMAKNSEYNVVENFTRAINYYNENCIFIYGSSTGVYQNSVDNSVDNIIKNSFDSYYDEYKFKSEKLIIKKLSEYIIVRIPLVLNSVSRDNFNCNVKRNTIVSTITKEDAGYAFAKILDHLNKYKKQVLNISGNDTFTLTIDELISKLVKNNALNWSMFLNLFIYDKSSHYPKCIDVIKFNNVLDYQRDEMDNYLARVKYNNKKKYFSKILKGGFIKLWERKK